MIEQKFIKVKRSKKSFLCALCRSPRQMRYTRNLSRINYFQILILSSVLSFFTWDFIGPKSFMFAIVIWLAFEVTNKLLYRKEIPCPYCGFDATWYRRDVRVARSRVKDFWLAQEKAQFKQVNESEEVNIESLSQ